MDKKLFELIEQVKLFSKDYIILTFDNSVKEQLKKITPLSDKVELLEGGKNNFPLTKDSIYIIPTKVRKSVKIVLEGRSEK